MQIFLVELGYESIVLDNLKLVTLYLVRCNLRVVSLLNSKSYFEFFDRLLRLTESLAISFKLFWVCNLDLSTWRGPDCYVLNLLLSWRL